MAILSVPEQSLTLREPAAIAARLRAAGITFEQWRAERPLPAVSSAEEVLSAYAREIAALKASGGYVAADVIDVHPDTPGLDAMLEKFRREHWHDEDEVRFTLSGRGLFHIRPPSGPVLAIEVEAGDLLRVPRGTWHWFNLCGERRVRVIRLFQDPSGWAPQYTASGADAGYQPLCLGGPDLGRA